MRVAATMISLSSLSLVLMFGFLMALQRVGRGRLMERLGFGF
jgi:hypothetical protein